MSLTLNLEPRTSNDTPFWTKRRVTVTGGAGFLGSFVVEKLRERGCQHIFVPRRCQYDLVDMEAIKRLYRDARPDLVIHLAARVGGIGANRANAGKFFYDNAMMGIQLIEQGRLYGLEKFVALGTVCAYPKFAAVPFKEQNLWEGYPEETNAPYGLAKKMLLVQSQAYRDQYGFNSIYLLPVNLYGPRDNFDLETSHVIPALIRKCLEAKEGDQPQVVCWGDGTSTREFLYVEDCAEAIILAGENYNKPDPVNVGAGQEISIKNLINLIAELTEYRGRTVWDTTKPNGQPRRCLNTDRAKELFGFTAKTNFREGLRRTVGWYLSAKKTG
jgi:GDP-L-fucose synthase